MLSTTRTIGTIGTFILGALVVAACGAAGTTPGPAGPTAGAPTAQPPVATPTTAPATTPLPTTAGVGAQHFTGFFTSSPVEVTPPTATSVAGVIQYREGVAEWTFTTNDRRMGGTATWHFNVDAHGPTGPEWGPLTVTDASGSWSGMCTAGAWEESDMIVSGCWLAGSGAYKDLSAYVHFQRLSLQETASVEGIIYPGAIPKF